MAYSPEHGDVYVLADTKKLEFSLGDGSSASQYSHAGNQWYIAGQAISKGQAVSIGTAAYASSIGTGSSGNVYISSTGIIDKTVGIALNSAVLGGRIEVQSFGLYQWFQAPIFPDSELGKTVYIAPGTYTSVSPIASQYTTSKSVAAAGNTIIELGLYAFNDAPNARCQLFLDFEGDARSTGTTSQFGGIVGEDIVLPDANTPVLLALNTDGKYYQADSRINLSGLSFRNTPIGLGIPLVDLATPYITTITNGSRILIQRKGVVTFNNGQSNRTWFLQPGLPVYMHQNGAITQNIDVISEYTDVAVPIGVALTYNSIYVDIEYMSSKGQAYQLGNLIITRPSHTAEYGYLLCVGSALNVVTTTTNPSGQVAGTYDGTQLFSVIGQAYGGTVQYTVSGTCAVGASFSLNGTLYTTTGTTAAALATQIGGITQANYAFSNPLGSVFQVVTLTGYNFTFSPPVGMSFTPSAGTYNLPNISNVYQIKYNSFMQQTPDISPMIRIDTGWTTYPQVPQICSGLAGFYLEVPTSIYGFDPVVSDLMVEIYSSTGGIIHKLDAESHIYTSGGSSPVYSKYGYSVDKDIANYIRINIASSGLAYYNADTQQYTALTNTDTYKIFVYCINKDFKAYIDRSQNINQLWSLGLVDYTIAYTIQGAGYFDRSIQAPLHTNRLNYDGNFYATRFYIGSSYQWSKQDSKTFMDMQKTFGVNGQYNLPIWDQKVLPSTATWTSICWSPQLNLFCAVASGPSTAAATSPDGINWTARTLPSSTNWSSICWSPELGLFCVVSYTGTAAATSPNGVTWTPQVLSVSDIWISICWSPQLGLFCAIGSSASVNASTSPDGINWTARTLPSSTNWSSICWSPELELFCAIASGSTVAATSSNGIVWTPRTLSTSASWTTVCWSPELGLFCAVAGGTYAASTSPDGINWTTKTLPLNYSWTSICWSSELRLFYIVAQGTSVALVSSDGSTWLSYNLPISSNWKSICWSPELSSFCAVSNTSGTIIAKTRRTYILPISDSFGNNRTIYPSSLGAKKYLDSYTADLVPPKITGSTFPSFSGSIKASCSSYSPLLKRLILLGNTSATSWYWDYGSVGWTACTVSPTSNQWNSVCWSPELSLFCAVGNTTTGFISSDGITWTSMTLPTACQSICWSPELGLFCVVSTGPSTAAATSPDGINWTARTLPSNTTWYSICWSSELGMFCAVSNTSGTAAATSPDGINWTARTLPATAVWQSICWSPELGLFCAVALNSNTIAISKDGITWKKSYTTKGIKSSGAIIWSSDARLFLIPSYNNSSISYSQDGYNWINKNIGIYTATGYITSLCYFTELSSFVGNNYDYVGGVNKFKLAPYTKL
jgi:hypothetical protein